MNCIETQKHNVPWRWVFLMSLMGCPYIMMFFIATGDGGMITFSMRKFIEDPFIINAVASCDIVFNILVGATCLYVSDRIWTRFGRRKPFVLFSWFTIAICMFMIPMANSIWTIIPMIILVFAAMDVGTTADMLVYEVVPPHQRARYEALKAVYLNALIIIFSLIMGSRFNEITYIAGEEIKGERWIYWTGSSLIFLGAICVMLFVKENKPEKAVKKVNDDGSILSVVLRPIKALLLERDLWPVYLLSFAWVLLGVNLGGMTPLLMTEQWGYTMQDAGVNVMVGCSINMLILPFVGYLADKFNRLYIFTAAVILASLSGIFWYIFVTFFLPDGRPKIWMIVAFGTFGSLTFMVAMLTGKPLTFDFVPRNMMGTAQTGINIVSSITKFVAVLGVGLWVKYYSKFFYYEGKTDYFSGYIYISMLASLGALMILYFAIQVRRGRVKALGRDGYETEKGEILDMENTDNKNNAALT